MERYCNIAPHFSTVLSRTEWSGVVEVTERYNFEDYGKGVKKMKE